MINIYKAVPEQSSAHFNLKNTMIPDVEGDFRCLSGSFTYDPENLDNSSIEAFIDVKTVETGNSDRDSHLKSEEVFNANEFPTIRFKSTAFKDNGEGILEVTGDLTVKNVTKKVILYVEKPEGPNQNILELSANTVINRDKFKIELGSLLEVAEILVGDDIQINMDIQLKKE